MTRAVNDCPPRTQPQGAPSGPMTGSRDGPMKLAENRSVRSHAHGRRHKPPAATRGQPLLIIGTTGDPIVPYERTVQLATSIIGSRLLTLTGHGHIAYRQSSCIRGHVVSYLNNGTLPGANVRCRE